ncbi:glycosyltransferase family 4 protein [Butyricimonas faecihominis]|jgi:UDP-N-acetylmuramyl pentapeptide phosphotransferase/UDP-N-acetylglucosamine-1-phosphate transferase|uniref:MraY family glycosyltransferase n=1 Tax=Butyricimonas faecihominis TaxID=1472416 RepID=UPI0032C07647
MINWIYGFVLLLLFVLENIYFKIAKRYNILDVPNARSSHHTITLRGGGVIFYLGVLVHGLIFDFFAPWFLCGLTLVALVSFIDDMHPLSAKVRLLIQTFSLLLLLLQLGVHEVSWGYVVVALFVGLAILNIYNFMDGINGITGGYSLVAMLALWGINAFVFPIAPAGFIPVVILSLLVFNFYNFRSRAKCFSGDVGAISMAFIILFLLGGFIMHTGHVSVLVFLAVYGVDGVLTIIHRILLKENIGQPHRKHLYQLLANEGKFAHLPVSLIYMGVQAVVNLGYLLVLVYVPEYTLIYFIISMVVLVAVYLPLRCKFYALREQV